MYLSCELVLQHSYETTSREAPAWQGAGGPRVPDVKKQHVVGECTNW